MSFCLSKVCVSNTSLRFLIGEYTHVSEAYPKNENSM